MCLKNRRDKENVLYNRKSSPLTKKDILPYETKGYRPGDIMYVKRVECRKFNGH